MEEHLFLTLHVSIEEGNFHFILQERKAWEEDVCFSPPHHFLCPGLSLAERNDYAQIAPLGSFFSLTQTFFAPLSVSFQDRVSPAWLAAISIAGNCPVQGY